METSLINRFNENKWVRLITNILCFSPVIDWIRINLFKNIYIENIIYNDMDLFGLITSLITTALLIIALSISRAARKELKITKELLQAYKSVSSWSNYYRAWKFYTRDGIDKVYPDIKLRDKILQKMLSEEYKYVYLNMKEDINNEPNIIYKLMADFYTVSVEDVKKLINEHN